MFEILGGVLSIESMVFEPFVDADVIAEYLSIERRQVLELARDGVLPAHPVDWRSRRKDWRFRVSEVDAAMDRKPVSSRFDYNSTRQPHIQKAS